MGRIEISTFKIFHVLIFVLYSVAKYLTSPPLHSLVPHLAYLCLTNTLPDECPPSIPQRLLWDKAWDNSQRFLGLTVTRGGEGTWGINDMDISVSGVGRWLEAGVSSRCLDPDWGVGVRRVRRWPQTYRPSRHRDRESY